MGPPNSKISPMKRVLLPLLAALTPAFAIAESSDSSCAGDVYNAVGRYLKIDNFLPRTAGGTVVAETCKPLPHDPSRLLAAIAYDTGIESKKSLVVALLDANMLRVIADYRETIDEDAVTAVDEGSLRLDTARYQLTPDLRAFGVRFKSSAGGPSCGAAADWDELTLLIQQKNVLRPVLRRAMQFQNALRGCIGKPTGHDVWESGKRTISVTSTRTNGFADLLITDTVTIDGNIDPISMGIETKTRTRSHLMKYDGKEYR